MPDVRGKKVVIFGDSLSAGTASPGAVLARELEAAGAIVKINAKVGRSAWSFYTSENGMQLAEINEWKPDLAIVMLGTNDVGLSMAVDGAKMKFIKNSLAQSAESVWGIGPPSFAAAAGARWTASGDVVAMMRPIFDGFIDWRPLSKDQTTIGRASDLIHFTGAGADIAGKRLAQAYQDAGGGIGWIAVAALAALAWAIFG